MKAKLWLLLFLVIFLASSASAKELSVEKNVAEKKLSVGESATVELHFSNPFNSDIAVQIVDKNVLGNNGIDVQCMEFTVRSGESVMQYDPIQLYSDGEFELDAVVVNYTDPETDQVESISSDTLKVEVSGKSTAVMQGIKTIYQCNGMNMQSTSFSSSSQQQKQQQQQMSQEQKQQMQDQMQKKKDAVQNNQMDQDASALKQEMQKQREEYKQMQKEVANRIQNDSEFKKQHEKLMKEGYNLTSGEVDPESGDTGKFKMNYQRADGESASLSGQMQNGTMEELSKRSSEMEKQMMQQMMNNSQYQQMSKELAQQGFNQTGVKYDLLGNETQASVQYSKPNGDTADITADFVHSTITEVRMEKDERPDYRRIGFLVILVATLLAAAFLLYKKYFWKKTVVDANGVVVDEKPVDYRKESKRMIEKAKKLFGAGEEKDAYALAGRAVRFFYTHHLGYKKELTNTQTVGYLRQHKMEFKDVQKCLNLCGMVEFAKYKANRKDFDSIVKVGEAVVKQKS